MIRASEIGALRTAAEIGERDVGDIVPPVDQREGKLDVVAAITFGAMVAADVAILVSFMATSSASKAAAAVSAAAWVAAMIALAAAGALEGAG